MRAFKLLTALFCLFLTIGCNAKRKVQEKPLISPASNTTNKVLIAADLAKEGKNLGLISLSHRKLSLKEISTHLEMDEETTKAHLKATNVHGYFSLLAKNYPPGIEFILYHIDLTRNITPTKGFCTTGDGSLVTQLDDQLINIENNYLFFSNYLPGEPVDFVLASKDMRFFAATRIVPNPIQTEDKNGRSLSVELSDSDKRQFLIRGKGLEPFTTYMVIAQFENEKFAFAVASDENGDILQPSGPTVPWVTGGDGTVELRGEALQNALCVHFRWGE